jgi:hypothetical protein
MLRFFNISKFEEMPNDAFIKDLRMEDGKREEGRGYPNVFSKELKI